MERKAPLPGANPPQSLQLYTSVLMLTHMHTYKDTGAKIIMFGCKNWIKKKEKKLYSSLFVSSAC